MIVVGIILVVTGGILIYWNCSFSPFKQNFTKQMQKRAEQIQPGEEVCTAEEIAKLPEPMQKYCAYIGLEGFPKYQVAYTAFKNTDFVFDAQAGTILNMDYDLWLFYDKPYRSAYCSSSMYGVPFDGIDYCTEDKQGGMKGILGKAVQIFDVCEEQGYQAGMISWLAESVAINPAAILSPYITYETIDDLHVKATIEYDGVSGSGIFTLNKEGAIIEFYSDERQVEEIDGVKTHVGWHCDYENYAMENGIMQIHTVRSTKIFPDKEVVYFDADDFEVTYIK